MTSRARIFRLLAPALLVAWSVQAGPAAVAADRILLMSTTDPAYAGLEIPAGIRVHPDAESRLLVFRGGAPVIDRGLTDRRVLEDPEGGAEPAHFIERGQVEDATVARDGRSAVIVGTDYTLRRDPSDQRRGQLTRDRLMSSDVTVTWIDREHPGGRWSIALENGRLVDQIYPFAGMRGVVLTTSVPGVERPDLRVYGPDLSPIAYFEDLESVPENLRPTPLDSFLGVQLSFPARPGVPDQGVLVVDLLHRTHWVYSWEYGSDREPVRWDLDDSGVLSVVSPDRVHRYDRLGRPLRARKKGR